MQRRNKWTEQLRCWEKDICDAISQVQRISQHEMCVLRLHLETHPLPFQPSPVLTNLLQNDRRRRSSIPAASTTLRKQQLKSAHYLDRKFESEIRQHYELENAQNCGKWKQFHFRATEARRQLAAGIERDFRQLCHQLGASADEVLLPNELISQVYLDRNNQDSESSGSPAQPAADAKSVKTLIQIEDTLRVHLAQEWVNQDRFNIEEAFTNQTKKLQEDLEAFLDHQEANFHEERQKVLNEASFQQCSQPENQSIAAKQRRNKAITQFQSSTKRGMLLQTAPPLCVESTIYGEGRLMQWRGTTAATRVHSSSRRIRSDVDETQEKLDEVQRRFQIHKEATETKRKDGMQWIGRQCAHMFTQLDCKETEARVVAMLLEEELTQLSTLRCRVSEIVSNLERLCTAMHSLPLL